MPLDFSGVDAELDALGSAPEHAVALARSLAGFDTALDQLQAIDHALGLLEAESPALPPASYGGWRAPELPSPARDPASEALGDDEPPPRESGPAPARQSMLAPALGASAEGLESWPPLAHSEAPGAADEDTPASSLHSVPPPALTQSQEIVLPDPIPREELSSESGELRLDDDKPSSGSFSLDAEPPPESSAFDAPVKPRIPSLVPGPQAHPSSAAPRAPVPGRPPRFSQLVNDDIGDALEGSQPISLGDAKRGPSRVPPFAFDRDPDAEFDALLSEATDPNGMPTADGDEDVDRLLQGLDEDTEDLHTDLATTEFNPDASAETEVNEATGELALLMLDEPEDATDVLDRATLGALEAATAKPAAEAHTAAEAAIEGAMPSQEDTLTEFESGVLEMGELEIVMEETPTKAPPPPPPPPAGEKRPSGFLGRFFGRGERE